MTNLIRTVYYLFFKLITLPFLRFPSVLYGMAKFMAMVRARVGYIGRGKSRKSYLWHMARALPEMNRKQLTKLLKAFWFVHQSNFIELFYLPTIKPNNVDGIVQYSPPALGDVDAVRLDFLHHPVEFSTTPARMAQITGAVLTTAWVHRLPGGRFRIVIDEPLPAPIPLNRVAWTRTLADRMERCIRQYTQEFYWMWLLIQSEETVPMKDEEYLNQSKC
jgi:lauroyl/myristoyl acyltransferase